MNITEREQQVLQLVANGLSNAQIGEKLWISEHTVKTHLRRISKRHGVTTRVQLVAMALREGAIF